MISTNRIASILRNVFLPLALLVSAAASANLPDYYPAEGFQRTAQIDAFIAEEQRIVLGDISYQLADNVIVHTPTSYSVPRTTLKVGDRIAYRMGGGRRIVEIWLLPRGYEDRRGRR